MNDTIITIDLKIFECDSKKCKDNIIDFMKNINDFNHKFTLHIIHNGKNNFNVINNMRNIILLAKSLDKVKKRIQNIKIFGITPLTKYIISMIKSILKYDIEKIIEYVDPI